MRAIAWAFVALRWRLLRGAIRRGGAERIGVVISTIASALVGIGVGIAIFLSGRGADDPTDLAITCDINGERKQEDRTTSLLFSVAELIEYLSAIITLDVGDVIFTGTPAGVGAASKTFLGPGDVITSSIEGIGTMVNTCR